ncbi:hypothetical protein VTJ49DRAFT_1020 [Mycothermus thermophilus]|uniref:DUF8021 domain-containing protein n=1 Tax=Humicola insolens TaxID=85995 RepID=A0ABR3VDH4_HUMIN
MPSLLGTLITTLPLTVLTTATSCSRPFLRNITSTYVAAQTAGDPSVIAALTTSSPNFIYLENNLHATLRYSKTLTRPLKIDFTRSIHDPDQCATFTEIIAASDPHPHVIHTRIVLDGATEQATLMESVITDEGDWLFNATGTLELNAGEAWDPIPLEEHATRAEVQALGDAYFDRFSNTSVVVPWSEPCYRLEGGLAARGSMVDGECEMVWPSSIVVPYRRYVVDVEMGAVNIFMGFPGLDRTQGQVPMPDSHLFRVEGGRIKYSHTASACVVGGCGLDGTGFGSGGEIGGGF